MLKEGEKGHNSHPSQHTQRGGGKGKTRATLESPLATRRKQKSKGCTKNTAYAPHHPKRPSGHHKQRGEETRERNEQEHTKNPSDPWVTARRKEGEGSSRDNATSLNETRDTGSSEEKEGRRGKEKHCTLTRGKGHPTEARRGRMSRHWEKR